MKKCQFCGNELNADDKFCPKCGHSQDPEAEKVASKGNFVRDFLIILAAVVIVVAAYMLFSSKPEPVQNATGFKHPEIPGMDMGMPPDLESAVAALPKTYDELIAAGNHYMDNGVYALAVKAYERALAIDSTDPNLMIDLGACYYSVNQDEKAISLFEKALRIDPDHVIGHFNMGIVYRNLGNKEKAIEHWKRVQELQPGTPLADTAISYIANYDKK